MGFPGVARGRGFPGVARVNKVTPVSLGYPLSVFNKNSTVKERWAISLVMVAIEITV